MSFLYFIIQARAERIQETSKENFHERIYPYFYNTIYL